MQMYEAQCLLRSITNSSSGKNRDLLGGGLRTGGAGQEVLTKIVF